MDKFEILTGEDLGYRADPIQKSDGLLKRLNKIEDKADNQLKAIEGQKDNQLDLVKNQKTKKSDPIGKIKFSDEKLNKLAEDAIKKTKKYEDEELEYSVPKRDKCNFGLYKNLDGFVKKVVNGEMSIKKAKEQQHEPWNEIFNMKKRTSEKRRVL